MKRQFTEQPIGAVLQQWIDESRLKTNLNESRVKQLWADKMGKTISTYTSAISVRKNVLYLHIISAPLRQELAFGKDKIVRLLNEALGEDYIRDVVIR